MTEGIGVDRRTLLTRVLLLVGAGATGVALDALAGSRPLLAAEGAQVLSPSQADVLAAYADTLIPQTDTAGALAAEVPAQFAALLQNWAAPQTRTALAAVLDRVGQLGGGFAAQPPAQRKTLLQALDAAALAPAPGPRANPFGPPPASDPDYQRLKELVLTLYYLSQPALTQELAYTHVPGRWEPSVPVTPATRPQGGPGMF